MLRRAAVLAVLGGLLALPSAASAQQSTSYVSGVGTDFDPCTQAAPCKTFQGAYSKTDAGGEIIALNSGGYGTVAITHAITIRAVNVTGGVLTNSGNGININAAATDDVILDGLEFEGLNTSGAGVQIFSAHNVVIANSSVRGFATGVRFTPTSAGTQLTLRDDQVYGNTIGVSASPGTAATGTGVLIQRSELSGTTCGVALLGSSTGGATPCGNGPASTPAFRVDIKDSTLADDTSTALYVRGGSATASINNNRFTGNAVGLSAVDGGRIIDNLYNVFSGNGTNGVATPGGETGPPGSAGGGGGAGAPGTAGPAGSSGPQGPAGPDGANGAAGPDGAAGPPGPPGPAGVTGGVGASGPPGTDGAPGPEGPAGPKGKTGAAGAAGARGPAGPVGGVTCEVTKSKRARKVKVTCTIAAASTRTARLTRAGRVIASRRVRAGTRRVTFRVRGQRTGRYRLMLG
jgi:hypothetical protein